MYKYKVKYKFNKKLDIWRMYIDLKPGLLGCTIGKYTFCASNKYLYADALKCWRDKSMEKITFDAIELVKRFDNPNFLRFLKRVDRRLGKEPGNRNRDNWDKLLTFCDYAEQYRKIGRFQDKKPNQQFIDFIAVRLKYKNEEQTTTHSAI